MHESAYRESAYRESAESSAEAQAEALASIAARVGRLRLYVIVPTLIFTIIGAVYFYYDYYSAGPLSGFLPDVMWAPMLLLIGGLPPAGLGLLVFRLTNAHFRPRWTMEAAEQFGLDPSELGALGKIFD